MRCTILTASKSPGIADGLSYHAGSVPVEEGAHVLIPLRNKTVEGLVIQVTDTKTQSAFALKYIQERIGSLPLLTPGQVQTLKWMAEYYLCSLRQALAVFLPSPPWRALLPGRIPYCRLTATDAVPARGRKQQEIIEFLKSRESVPLFVLRKETGASKPVIDALVARGVLELFDVREGRMQDIPPLLERPRLTPLQQQAYETIRASQQPSLLFGITGSGKTEIYAQLIADAVEAKRQAILLVPEILLTEHTIDRFLRLLPKESIAVVHSRLSPKERREAWRRIHRGDVQLVIGSRSALFAPLPSLGLVIIDEEHEWTYKNEQTPRYHARETAEVLCRASEARLVLGSATPSVESWAKGKSGRYTLVRLPERYGAAPLPSVRVIDLAQASFGKVYPFTPPLIEAIDTRLKRGEQSILFLNRRGIGSALLCLSCRRRLVSPVSQLPFTVHRTVSGDPYLLDHTTGVSAPLPARCPACASADLRIIGAGTQRVEDQITELFPSARVLRADSDTLTHPEQMRLLLKHMREGTADILLGTQSVAKGLDLPGVTLAAVLIADIGLSLPHFRAGERVFQLLTQLTGRSGRRSPGDVIIQTYRPDAMEVKLAAEHRTEDYLNQELALRLHLRYPPATEMIRLLVRGPDAQVRAEALARAITATAAGRPEKETAVSVSETLFGGGREWQVLLRGEALPDFLHGLDLRQVTVDRDPIECA